MRHNRWSDSANVWKALRDWHECHSVCRVPACPLRAMTSQTRQGARARVIDRCWSCNGICHWRRRPVHRRRPTGVRRPQTELNMLLGTRRPRLRRNSHHLMRTDRRTVVRAKTVEVYRAGSASHRPAAGWPTFWDGRRSAYRSGVVSRQQRHHRVKLRPDDDRVRTAPLTRYIQTLGQSLHICCRVSLSAYVWCPVSPQLTTNKVQSVGRISV